MSTINEIIDVTTHRNGVSGLPFMTALVDMDLDGRNENLSISFAYRTNGSGEINGYAKDEEGLAICFVLNLEGMFEGTLKHAYRGDSIIHDHGKEIIAEYKRRDDLKWQSLTAKP